MAKIVSMLLNRQKIVYRHIGPNYMFPYVLKHLKACVTFFPVSEHKNTLEERSIH